MNASIYAISIAVFCGVLIGFLIAYFIYARRNILRALEAFAGDEVTHYRSERDAALDRIDELEELLAQSREGESYLTSQLEIVRQNYQSAARALDEAHERRRAESAPNWQVTWKTPSPDPLHHILYKMPPSQSTEPMPHTRPKAPVIPFPSTHNKS